MIADRNIHVWTMAVVHPVSIQWPTVQYFMVINCLLCSSEKKLVVARFRTSCGCRRKQHDDVEDINVVNRNRFSGRILMVSLAAGLPAVASAVTELRTENRVC